MSITAMAWAWKQDVQCSSDKLILLALADHSDNDGICWPGANGIAEKCNLGRRTVFRAIERLEQLSLLSRQFRTRQNGSITSNSYTLNITPPSATVTPPLVSQSHPPNHQIEPSLKHQKTTPLPPKGDDGFDQFWQNYPKKVAKLAARKAWHKLPSPDLQATILATLERFKASPDWVKDYGKFIPHAATWLNGRRWEDELSSSDDDFYPFPVDDEVSHDH